MTRKRNASSTPAAVSPAIRPSQTPGAPPWRTMPNTQASVKPIPQYDTTVMTSGTRASW